MLLFLVLTFHFEHCHREVTSRTCNFEKSELSKNFPSRNYELESCSYGSFLLGIWKLWELLHSWCLVSGNLQAVKMSFPTSAHLMCKVGEGKKQNKTTKVCQSM